MTKTPAFIAAVSLVALTFASTLSAQTALRDVAKVRDGIMFVGMAYEISEKCSSIQARTFRGIGYLQSLKTYAQDQGFSNAEIDAYIDNRVEKRRLERLAREQLAALGVNEGDAASYCTVGRAQMAANTRVGWLLR